MEGASPAASIGTVLELVARAYGKESVLAGTQELDELIDEARRKAKDEPDPGVVYTLDLLDEKLHPAH